MSKETKGTGGGRGGVSYQPAIAATGGGPAGGGRAGGGSCGGGAATAGYIGSEADSAGRSFFPVTWPPHKAALYLTHNDHLSVYQTVQQCIDRGDHGYGADCWISEEQRAKAITTNDCWTLQWYPETPVGFSLFSAADLEALLKFATASS